MLSPFPTKNLTGALRGHLPYILTLGLLFGVVAYPWMKPSVNWITFHDNTNCFVPIMAMLARKWQAHGAPLFSSEFIGGFPFYANPHFNVFYPFYFLYTGAYQTPELAVRFMHQLVLLHLFILCLNTYILCGTLGLRKWTGILVGLGLTFSAATYPSLHYLTITAATAWLPLVLAALCLIFRGSPWAGAATLAFSSLMMIGAMPAQVLAITVVASVCFVLGHLIPFGARSPDATVAPRAISTACIALALAAALITAIAGPYLVNVQQFHASSIRWAGGHPPIGPGEAISREILQEFALDLKELRNLLYMTYTNSVAGHIYTGGTVFLLAVVGAYSAVCRRRRTLIILIVVALVFLSFCFRPVVGLINYHLPLINLVREASWFGVIYTLIAFCAAGLGLERLIEGFSSPGNYGRFTLLALAAAVLLVASFYVIKIGYCPDLPSRDLYVNLLALGVLSIPLFLGLFFVTLAPPLRAIIPLLGFAIALYPINLPTAPKLADNDTYSAASIEIRAVLKHLTEVAPDFADFRTDVPPGGRIDWSMSALNYGIRTYHGYLTPQVAEIFENMYWITARPMAARVAGLKYRIRAVASERSAPDWTEVGRYAGWIIEKDSKAFPRIFAASGIAGTYDPKDAQTYWRQVEQSDPTPDAVFLPGDLADGIRRFLGVDQPSVSSTQPADGCSVLSATDELVSVECDFRTPRILVLNEYKSREWKVAIDREPVKSFEVNHTQIAALIPAGRCLATFEYAPPPRFGIRLFGLGALIVSVGLLRRSKVSP